MKRATDEKTLPSSKRQAVESPDTVVGDHKNTKVYVKKCVYSCDRNNPEDVDPVEEQTREGCVDMKCFPRFMEWLKNTGTRVIDVDICHKEGMPLFPLEVHDELCIKDGRQLSVLDVLLYEPYELITDGNSPNTPRITVNEFEDY